MAKIAKKLAYTVPWAVRAVPPQCRKKGREWAEQII